MLNPLHLSPGSRPPFPAPNLPRYRGGQPSNHNALKHGLYARRSPTPLTRLDGIVEVLTLAIPALPPLNCSSIVLRNNFLPYTPLQICSIWGGVGGGAGCALVLWGCV